MKLPTIVRELSERVRLARNVTDLTGGTSGVDGLSVAGGGTGYANSFAETFTGGGGSGAAGTATAIGGAVVSVDITNPGTGYTSAPTPNFSAGGGTGCVFRRYSDSDSDLIRTTIRPMSDRVPGFAGQSSGDIRTAIRNGPDSVPVRSGQGSGVSGQFFPLP